MDQQIVTKKKVSFQLDGLENNEPEPDHKFTNNNERLMKKSAQTTNLRVLPFCVQRIHKSSTTNSTLPMTIKENHSPDLSKLTIVELGDLLKKQAKMLENKTLLSKLNDKGSRIKTFHDKIAKAIKDKEIEDTENMFNKMAIDSEKNTSHTKPIDIVKNSDDISAVTLNNRFNLPKSTDTIVKVSEQSNGSNNKNIKETLLKINMHNKEIKTLNWDDSLKTLEIVSHKEQDAVKDQILRFYNYRTSGNVMDFDSELGDSCEELDSDDDDVIVNVNSVSAE